MSEVEHLFNEEDTSTILYMYWEHGNRCDEKASQSTDESNFIGSEISTREL